jgi:hypothetical protein
MAAYQCLPRRGIPLRMTSHGGHYAVGRANAYGYLSAPRRQVDDPIGVATGQRGHNG